MKELRTITTGKIKGFPKGYKVKLFRGVNPIFRTTAIVNF
jgi:hypothetical protein